MLSHSSNPFLDPAVRSALVRAHPVFQARLDDLPRQVGGCAWGAALIACVLAEQGVDSQVVIGTFRRGRWRSDHCWAQGGDWILDWAAGQFKVGTPWLLTPACDGRYVRATGQDLSIPAQVIGGWPGRHACARISQVMAPWPIEQQAAGPAFEAFLTQGLAAARGEAKPEREHKNTGTQESVLGEDGIFIDAEPSKTLVRRHLLTR